MERDTINPRLACPVLDRRHALGPGEDGSAYGPVPGSVRDEPLKRLVREPALRPAHAARVLVSEGVDLQFLILKSTQDQDF